jgi:hypothetical protein
MPSSVRMLMGVLGILILTRHSGNGPVAGACEHGNEFSGSGATELLNNDHAV